MLEMMNKSFCVILVALFMRDFVVTQGEEFGFRGRTPGHRKQETGRRRPWERGWDVNMDVSGKKGTWNVLPCLEGPLFWIV